MMANGRGVKLEEQGVGVDSKSRSGGPQAVTGDGLCKRVVSLLGA